jgi:hypothetical protein
LFVFRVGLAQLFVRVRLSEFSFGLQRVGFLFERWQGGKQCFLSSRGECFGLALLGLRGFPFDFRRFLFERREGEIFVELVVLMFLFRDGLTQFFVGV